MKWKIFSYISYFLCICGILEALAFIFEMGDIVAYANRKLTLIMGISLSIFMCMFANSIVKISKYVGKYEIGILAIAVILMLYIGRYLF